MARACITIMAALLLFVGLTGCQQQPVAVMPMPEASARDYFDAGMRAFGAGDYNQAASQFDGAIRLAPGMADAYWYLGMCYAKMGMAGRAADTYRSGLAVAPGHMGMHEALGLLSYAMNDYPQARRELGRLRHLGLPIRRSTRISAIWP
ncbi:MAG: tetratricopeptide repeat protein [Solidesulfovibrio sp.]